MVQAPKSGAHLVTRDLKQRRGFQDRPLPRPSALLMLVWEPPQDTCHAAAASQVKKGNKMSVGRGARPGDSAEHSEFSEARFSKCFDSEEEQEKRRELIELARARISDELDPEQRQQMLDLLIEFLPTLDPTNLGRSSYYGKFKIDTGEARPVQVVPWRSSPNEKDVIRAEIEKMLRLGVIHPSNSSWCTIPVLVKKPDGSFRFAIDYRGPNKVTVFDASPIPGWMIRSLDLRGRNISQLLI